MQAGDAVVPDVLEQLLAVGPHGQSTNLFVGAALTTTPHGTQSTTETRNGAVLACTHTADRSWVDRSGRAPTTQPHQQPPHATTLTFRVQRCEPPDLTPRGGQPRVTSAHLLWVYWSASALGGWRCTAPGTALAPAVATTPTTSARRSPCSATAAAGSLMNRCTLTAKRRRRR